MKELFVKDEWELICEAPYLIFKFIASVDHKVDSKEFEAFNHFCRMKNSFSSTILREVLPDEPEKYLYSFSSHEFNKNIVKEKLRNIDLFLDYRTDISDSVSFKHHLIALGVYIANASGKIFSHKISEEEDAALVALGNYIDIDVNQLFRTTLVDEILKKL